MSDQEKRTKGKLSSSGPFLAEITNHLDPESMGGVEVALIRLTPNLTKIKGDVYPVRYLSPFYGVTNKRFIGEDIKKFDHTQKSYGMWMIPPDIGTTVLVIFVDGDANQGYIIGCIPDRYQNFMLPGLAASENVHITQEEITKYNFGDKVKKLPVAEVNTTNNGNLNSASVDDIKKPIHPFTERLVEQGLLKDEIRGVTSSSARREQPSHVFGISTPGPVDPNGRKQQIGYETKRNVPMSRLGGSTFVMDDGDINGNNELVRIRTRTGHQILLHNTKDLIYIANSRGTAWLEFTSDGKIDIYAADSISIRTENDFNFRADRDINFEAGRNININSTNKIDMSSDKGGRLKLDENSQSTMENFNLNVRGNIKISADESINLTSKSTTKINAGGLNLGSTSTVLVNATKIYLNGASTNVVKENPAELPDPPEDTKKFKLPATSYKKDGWGNKQYYKTDDLNSSLKRVPMHEPWDHHESEDPDKFKSDKTDVENSEGAITKPGSVSTSISPASIDYKVQPNISGTPPSLTGDIEKDNINAFLWTIRVCEGTSGPNGYRTQYTGKLFDSFADHPREPIRAPINGKLVTSTAAGAYQFLSRTWDQAKKSLNLSDFSPPNQDKAAIYLLQRAGALNAIKSGNFKEAIARTNNIWAGLPGSPYNQNPKTFGFALAAYQKAGGKVIA